MKQETNFIIVETAEPIELPDMLERNYTVCKPVIARKATVFVDKVLEGLEPFRVVENLSAIQQFIKAVEADDRLNDYVVTELTKYGGKMNNGHGTKIEKVEAGTKYDYSKCGDTVLPQLEKQMAEIKRQIEHRKAFLTAAPVTGCEIMVDGGELITIYPPTKTSTTTYKVTLSPKESVDNSIGDDLPF